MASLTAFDQHFEQWDGGVSCRDLDSEAGWLQDGRGRWTTVKLAAKADGMRERFAPQPLLSLNERAGASETPRPMTDLPQDI
jgi:hypothetical protein